MRSAAGLTTAICSTTWKPGCSAKCASMRNAVAMRARARRLARRAPRRSRARRAREPRARPSAAHAAQALPRAPTPAIGGRARRGVSRISEDMSIHDTMIEDPLNKLVLFDQLETQDADGRRRAALGSSTRGSATISASSGSAAKASADPVTPNAPTSNSCGARPSRDGGSSSPAPAPTSLRAPDQEWAAVGVRGLAPYGLGLEATAYIGSGGRTALRVDTRYELLVTNRLILEPSLELDWHGESGPRTRPAAQVSPRQRSVCGCATRSVASSRRTSASSTSAASAGRLTSRAPRPRPRRYAARGGHSGLVLTVRHCHKSEKIM